MLDLFFEEKPNKNYVVQVSSSSSSSFVKWAKHERQRRAGGKLRFSFQKRRYFLLCSYVQFIILIFSPFLAGKFKRRNLEYIKRTEMKYGRVGFSLPINIGAIVLIHSWRNVILLKSVCLGFFQRVRFKMSLFSLL